MKPSSILLLIVFLLLVALMAGLGIKMYSVATKKEDLEEKKVKIIPVHVAEVGTGPVEDVVYVTGYVEPEDRVDCYAKIALPGKLIRAEVEKGDWVRKDQVLAKVDRDEIGAEYLDYPVKAPASGLVAYVQDAPGSIVSPQQSVATILKTDRVKVVTSLIEADLGRVDVGDSTRVMVDAYPGEVFEGKVGRIDPVLDEFSHTAVMEVEISNRDHRLKPKMFARVEVVADRKSDVVVLPREVVLSREGISRVFVVGTDTSEPGNPVLRIYLTEVELGYYDLKKYEIVSGVEAGALVIDRDLMILKDQIPVSVINPPEGWVDPTEPEEGMPPPAQGSDSKESGAQDGATASP